MKTYEHTKKICIIAMLVAISFILGSAAIRIGAGIKLSLKFLSVFISSVLFGPFWGGMCGALSDALSYLINPGSGAFMPQITLVEFLYGFSFGFFFYKSAEINRKNILKILLCLVLNTTVLSIGVMSLFLKDLIGLDYISMLIYRIPSSLLNMLIQFIGLFVILKYMPVIKKLTKIQ